MPSNTKLTDLLADMQDLVAIDSGEVSPLQLSMRPVVLGTFPPTDVAGFIVVPRGYTRDPIPADIASDSWEKHLDDPENVAAHRAQMEELAARFELPAPPSQEEAYVDDPPLPGSTDDEKHQPIDEKPDSMLAKVRKAIGRG